MSCNIVFFTNNFYGYRHYAYISPVWLSLLFQGGLKRIVCRVSFCTSIYLSLEGSWGDVGMKFSSFISFVVSNVPVLIKKKFFTTTTPISIWKSF